MPGIQFDFVLPGILNHGDIEDVVGLIDPASILILGGDEDKWSIGIKKMVEYARASFKCGLLDFEVFSGGHQFTAEMRERAYNFLSQQLKSES